MKQICLILLLLRSTLFCSDICLSLIIKNDETVIEDCLNSVREIVDCISICDVGSEDRTLELIKRFMLETGIRGKIYKHAWKNQGHNRTLAAEASREMLKEFGYDLTQTYLLPLECEMVVKLISNFDKDSLNKDGYLILEKSSPLACYNYTLKLLKASLPWKSYGLAYEYWSSSTSYECEKIQALVIEDQGNNLVRQEENVRLIQEELRQEPNNERYIFYLAQSLKSLKRYEEAINWYKKRIELKGDSEEIWFSKFMLGDCYKELKKWDAALFWYLEAYQYNPDRTDPLLNVATYYRWKGQNDLAYIFSKYGSQIPAVEEQIFFNSLPGQNYRFNEELSIAAYYTRFREDGFDAADHLVLTRNVPGYIKHQTYKNLLFYVKNLPNARYMPIAIDFPLITEDSSEKYHPMNPSLLKTDEGYEVICRTVNYTQTGAKIFNTIDPTGIFRTRNFLVQYDKNFRLISQHEITENLSRMRVRSWIASHIQGLDDSRIFSYQEQKWFSCTTGDTNPTGNFQISLCRLADHPIGSVDKLIPLIGPDLNRCEKNWLPIIKNRDLFFIYSYDPFTVLKPNLLTGECDVVLSYQPMHDFSSFRGSAAPIRFDEGYLTLVHEIIHMEDHTRRYLHRLVFLDNELNVKKLSRPFTFKHLGIEFCCGMTWDHSGKEIIFGLGIEDSEAYLCFVDIDTIRTLLSPR